MPPSLLADVQACGVPMLQMFGLTESSAMATLLPPHDAARKLGSAGLPVPRTRIEILDADDRPCPPGEVGEIVIHGPQVMQGYWRNDEATASTLRGGGLHTGDLGYLDDEGYLYVVDRAKDMLITGGLNVYPAEIERVLAALPGITELAVIGVPHDRVGRGAGGDRLHGRERPLPGRRAGRLPRHARRLQAAPLRRRARTSRCRAT